MVKIYGKTTIWNKRLLNIVEGDNLYTYIGFGVIDRGTNVLQIRPTTMCVFNCIFCSVDAGPLSRNRFSEFIVEIDSLINTFNLIVRFKNCSVEALIDTIGEGLTYPHIFDLIMRLRSNPLVKSIAIETHGLIQSKTIVKKLEESGLDRINLSIDTLNKEKAKYLMGVSWFNVEKVIEIAEYVVKETNIDLHVTPLWIPGVNDEDVIKVVEWAYKIGAGKKWPPATIQKYVVHRFGRKVPGVREISWSDFWKFIRIFEEKFGLRIKWSMEEWGMFRTLKYPCPYTKGDRLFVKIISPGVFRGEYLGFDADRNILVTVIGRSVRIGFNYLVEVIEDKDCLLIVKPIKEIHI
ncbi:MAG: radical SAM protein [Desulfurococcaceae archaeon]